MSGLVLPWLWAFLFTQAVEVPIWAHALGQADGRRAGRRRGHDPHAPHEPRELWVRLALGFGASALTHPIVWFVFPRLAPGTYWLQVAQAEAFAVLVEAAYMSLLDLPNALAWSLLANGASAGLGLMCRAIFGVP